MSTYYPLKAGNSWTYKTNDGSTFTNTVETENGDSFSMSNTMAANKIEVKKEGNIFYTDSYETGNMQPFLKDAASAGDAWEIKYKANGIDSMLNVVIKNTGGTKEVEGKQYNDVMEMEGMMSFVVNGNVFNAGTKYQWYYAKDVGLILTTSSLGDNMPLINYTV